MSYIKKYDTKDKKVSSLLVGNKAKIKKSELTESQKAADEVFSNWWFHKNKERKQILRIGGPGGSGKAQPDDTMIPTPIGVRRLDSLEVGDYVYDIYGNPTLVLGVYPQGVIPTYEITFTDGRKTRCNDEHLWYVDVNSHGHWKEHMTVIPLKDIITSFRTSKYRIPLYRSEEIENWLYFENIVQIESTSQRCIMVDNPLHVYLTNDYIPTHNTYLLRYLLEHYGFNESNCYVMAYTGQATNVLRQSGIMARTIHSSIMIPRDEPVLDKNTHKPIYRNGIPLTTVKFKPLKRLPKGVRLLIVDEASFLPLDMENTLKSFGIPILEIGDPIQLPPVSRDAQPFHLRNLDYIMTGSMRQKAGSELLDFCTRFRRLENIDTRKYHDDVLFLYAQPTLEETFWKFYPFFKSANVIVTADNKQRQVYNDLYREHILKTNSPFPIEGERMICRRNNHGMSLGQYTLVNGTQGVCLRDVGRSMVDKGSHVFYMDFQPFTSTDPDEYYGDLMCDTDFLHRPYGVDMFNQYKPGEKFEYAHAITTHLMQGAQEDTVMFMDTFKGDQEYLWRLRYTAATRAKKRLIYVIPYSHKPGWSDIRFMEDSLGSVLGDLVR